MDANIEMSFESYKDGNLNISRSLVNADNVMDCMHVYAMPGRDDSVIEDKDFASDV
ncbi:hypothetical protein CPB97_001689 [Podila verticillata]|nr:hypothetical protein CPB97_001689 [Podila verticillata]